MRVQTRANPTRQHGVELGRCAVASHFITLAALLSGHCRDNGKRTANGDWLLRDVLLATERHSFMRSFTFQAVRLHSAMQSGQDPSCGSTWESKAAPGRLCSIQGTKKSTNRHLSPLRTSSNSPKAVGGLS
ncbi:hypothetical protein TgHK011_007446 [Trichoderma gracile]|nr:hypothetical protein TgHK011_007446 [Trichoderma gracile]